MHKNLVFWLEVAVFYALPIVGLGLSPYFLTYRPYLFAFGLIYVLVRALFGGATLKSWGFRSHSLFRDLSQLTITTFALPILVFLVLKLVTYEQQTWLIGYDMLAVELPTRLLLYIFVSVPIQELIFRSYLTWRLLNLAWSKNAIIWTSSILFVIGHLPFHSPIMLSVVTVMGSVYSRVYLKNLNIYPIIVSHAISGSLLIIVRNYFLPY